MTTPDQIDRDAADKWAHAEDNRDAMIQAFAAHRQAALLEGVRIGLAAAADDAVTWFPEATTGKYRAGGVVGSIRALDHATVLARHGGA